MDMKRTEIAKLAIVPVDAIGNPAPVTDVLWAVVPAEAGTITPSETGVSATFVPAVSGPVTISVQAKNAAGELLSETADLVVLELVAVTLGLTTAIVPAE